MRAKDKERSDNETKLIRDYEIFKNGSKLIDRERSLSY